MVFFECAHDGVLAHSTVQECPFLLHFLRRVEVKLDCLSLGDKFSTFCIFGVETCLKICS